MPDGSDGMKILFWQTVVLANPRKTKLIAEAKIKSDRLDARALATLLQGNLVFESCIRRGHFREASPITQSRAERVGNQVSSRFGKSARTA